MVTTLLRPVIAYCRTISTAEHLKTLLPLSVNLALPTPAPLLGVLLLDLAPLHPSHVPLAQGPLPDARRINRLVGGLIVCVYLHSATSYILK